MGCAIAQQFQFVACYSSAMRPSSVTQSSTLQKIDFQRIEICWGAMLGTTLQHSIEWGQYCIECRVWQSTNRVCYGKLFHSIWLAVQRWRKGSSNLFCFANGAEMLGDIMFCLSSRFCVHH